MSKTIRDIKFFDPEETFELNENMSISKEVTEDGDILLVIDDFYKNPEMVEDLIVNTPFASTTSTYKSAYNSYRIWNDLTIQNKNIFPFLTNVIKEVFNLHGFMKDDEVLIHKNRSLVANIYTSEPNTSNPNRRTYPHWDPAIVSALVYFDNDEKLGTALYKHKPTDVKHIMETDDQYELFSTTHGLSLESIARANESNKEAVKQYQIAENEEMVLDTDDFEVTYKTKPKYNRLVAFLGSTLHSPMVDYGYLKDENKIRVTQVMFLNKVKKRF